MHLAHSIYFTHSVSLSVIKVSLRVSRYSSSTPQSELADYPGERLMKIVSAFSICMLVK